MAELNEIRHPDYTPKHTLYIKNLNQNVKIDGSYFAYQDLRQILFTIFSRYGKLLGITAKHNIRMKGQAFIVYENREDAQKAKEVLDRAVVFKKEMVR